MTQLSLTKGSCSIHSNKGGKSSAKLVSERESREVYSEGQGITLLLCGHFSLMKPCFIKIGVYPELGASKRLKSEILKPAPFPARWIIVEVIKALLMKIFERQHRKAKKGVWVIENFIIFAELPQIWECLNYYSSTFDVHDVHFRSFWFH